MSAPIPEELHQLAVYLKRADQLEERDPLMAYYCRYYVVKQGIEKRKGPNKEAIQGFLMHLLDRLEQSKKTLSADLLPLINDEVKGKEYVQACAMRAFLRADNEDRKDEATEKTSRGFFTASILFEVMNVFGSVDAETKQKIKYAKWKAADIMKAIKEGRKPVPGPPGGDPNLPPSESDFLPTTSDAAVGSGPSASMPMPGYYPPSQPGYPPSSFDYNQPMPPAHPPQQPQQPQQPPSQPPYNSNNNNVSRPLQPSSVPAPSRDDYDDYEPLYDMQLLNNAQKFARFAISALQYEDINTAMENLQKSMDQLKMAVTAAASSRQGARKR